MNTRFVEVTNGERNWGKFMLARFDEEEWARPSTFGGTLIGGRGWSKNHVLVFDLETGEGAMFKLGGVASADLNDKHQIWVCPMFEPFLNWLYGQPQPIDFAAIPNHVDLPDAEFAMAGYRRSRGEKSWR
jgi:hypothetical protein